MAYRWTRGILMRAAERPVRWPVITLAISAIVSFGLYVLPDAAPRIMLNDNRTDVVTYFSGPWSVQAAVAALVYPIVLAFVTLVLQRRNAKSILHILLARLCCSLFGLNGAFPVDLHGRTISLFNGNPDRSCH